MNNDSISRDALREAINNYLAKRQDVIIWDVDMFDMLDNAPTTIGWIPIKTRELTAEEKTEYPDITFMWDCPLPDDAQDVLISTSWGDVKICTFCVDEYGSYFDEMDEDDVLAWMPLPEPYTKENDNG